MALTPEGLSIQAGHIRHGTQDLGHFGPYFTPARRGGVWALSASSRATSGA